MKRLLKPELNPSAGTNYRVPRSFLLKLKPLAILALCLVIFCMPCEAQQNIKTVLFLHSETADAPVFVAEEQRIRSILTSAFGNGVQFFVEYMDHTRVQHSGYLDSLAAYLHEKYASRRIDLEVAIGPEALPFIINYRNALSPLTPVVFSYPDVGFLNRTSLPANITGLIPQLEIKPTLDLILMMQPETKMVAIVLGPTSTRPNLANYLESVKTQIVPFRDRLAFTFIGEGGIGDVTSQVAALPPGTPTLYLFYVGDRGKNFISAVNAADVVTNVAKGPVYDTSDGHMGHGIVGGWLNSDTDYQTDIAQLALRVLQGAMPPPRVETQQSRYIFDERQLKRWKIDPHKLPPGSEIRFHQPTVWEQYKWAIIAGVGVIAFQTLLITGLLVQQKKRRRAEAALLGVNRTLETQAALLQSREELLKIFVRHVPAAVAMLDRDMRYLQVSDRWCTDYLRGRAQVLGCSHYEIFPDMPERWKEVHRRGLQGETLRDDEDRWDGQDGPHWARWEVRPWKTPEGTVGGILILTEDITRRKQMEEALCESEDKLRLLLDSTAEAIYGIDLEHRCTFCNPACLRTLGYERMDEVLGKNTHDLLHHSRADGTVIPVEECRVHRVTQSGEGVHAEDEVFWRANGTSFPAEYWSYPQRRGQELVGAVVAFVDITERKLAEAALANVSRKLIEAQEQERIRIGRELHDDIGQRLSLLAVELQQLHENSLILPEVRSRMGELQKQTSEIVTDIQSLSHELHSAKLQYLGIAAAMRGFCQEFGEQQKVQIDFKTHDLPSRLSPEISLCLFRVLQESLHNSAKHSGVRQFEVRLWGRSDEIHLTVKDSGAGFDREAAKESRGLGLISMEERLKLVKGTLSINSQPKRGTTIHARVPLSSVCDSMRAAG